MKRTKKIVRNKFVLATLFFLVWMTFIDNNDFFRQIRLYKRLNEVKKELKVRDDLISDTQRQLKELKNKKLLEKFAREQYYFKKHGEEVFVVVSEEEMYGKEN